MKALLRVEQAMIAALEHSITHPTIMWHDIGTDITVRNAVERLAKRGAVEINVQTNRYRLKGE
jgi:hypothetical protein